MKAVLIILTPMLFMLTGCRLEKKQTAVKTQAHIDAEDRAAKVTTPKGSCFCDSGGGAYCAQTTTTQAINQFMNGNVSITKTITWSYCSSQPATSDPDCNTPLAPAPTSQLYLCWYDCNTVTAKIFNKPPCLPCYPNNFCLQLTPVVQGNIITLQGYYNATSELLIEIVISADPNITIKCISGTGANSTTYVCHGNYP